MTRDERKEVLAAMAERLSERDKGAVMATMDRRLRDYRQHNGLTYDEMADRLGISMTQYRKYESGKAFPHASTIYMMARAMNVMPGWIMGEPAEKRGENE